VGWAEPTWSDSSVIVIAAVRSRWLTFDLECSLRRLADGDWIGNHEPATVNPCQRGRCR
jgi:hypothetical protein